MTEFELRNNFINTAQKYEGYKESDNTHRYFIDLYNQLSPLPRNYKVKYTDSWCAVFVSAISILCHYTDFIFPECSCNVMLQAYQKAGRWQEDDSYIPSAGDIIMYDWDDSKIGDCKGFPDHVGIIISVKNGMMLKVIEGNKSDSVSYRSLKINSPFIRGYCLPNYALKASDSSISYIETTVTPILNNSSVPNKVPLGKGKITAAYLNVRKWAGKEYPLCSFSPLARNELVDICDAMTATDGNNWYYICFNGKYGFVNSNYICKL